jgi:hypothetical protein
VVITIPLLRAHALHGVAGVFLRVAS